MDISDQMVSFYLRNVTSVYFAEHDLPPDELSGYLEYVEGMKKEAVFHGDLETLRLGFEHLLGNPQLETEPLAATEYPFRESEIREIVRYARKIIWPDAAPIPPGGPPGVKIVRMSIDDWWAHTGHRPKG
jgi:hypothetical protein